LKIKCKRLFWTQDMKMHSEKILFHNKIVLVKATYTICQPLSYLQS